MFTHAHIPATLIVPPQGPAPRAVAQDAWLAAKERAGTPISGAQLSRLDTMTSHWPADCGAPMVDLTDLSEVAAATALAAPAVSRAVARRVPILSAFGWHRPSGGDAA